MSAGETEDTRLRIARVIDEANRVFGDPKRAERWLATKHQVLSKEPIKLLTTDAGAQEVLDELSRINRGDLA